MRLALRDALVARQRIFLPTLVLYEWLRGPRGQAELEAQEALFPAAETLPFGVAEARIAADLYRELPRPRGREVDLAIAACALSHDAMLWTLNPNDFGEVRGLRLWE